MITAYEVLQGAGKQQTCELQRDVRGLSEIEALFGSD